jgi:putative tricarboxylic transport membrane protein
MEIGTDITWDIFTGLLLNTLSFWWMMIPAVILGLVVGAIPGFSAANTIIILLPLTFAMDVEAGLVFMVALYSASRMGAGIPAILVNIPGTAGAAATPLDGYPMARQGRGQQALAISFVACTAGGLLTTIRAAGDAVAGPGQLLHAFGGDDRGHAVRHIADRHHRGA